MNNNQKNNGRLKKSTQSGKKLIAALLLLAVGASAGYAAFKGGKGNSPASNTPPSETVGPSKPVAQIPTTPEANSAKPKGNISPYTGLEVSDKTMNNIPFMTIIENSKPARPQSGLSEADIVFETMAEGGIPRFIALFHSNSPKQIGPVRSARPYFVMLAKEFNLPFGHCGGSPEALETIEKEKLMSMNEYSYTSSYWRDKTRKAPHNLYTSADKLRKLITDKNFQEKPTSSLKFDKAYWNGSYNKAEEINMKLNQYYSTSYKYKDGLYYKSMDNEAAMDNANNKEIAVTNVVIQISSITSKPNDEKGRLDIKQVGQGKGYLISNGKYINIKWSKKDENSPTLLTDEQGKDVYLSPGSTWWHITDDKGTLDIR